MWEVEEIPDEDLLFYRVHHNNINNGTIVPGAFRERGEGDEKGMSTNWSKYSTPNALLDVAKSPEDNSIIEFIVKRIREIDNLTVEHAPLVENRSHTNVKGIPAKNPLKTKVRLKLLELYNWSVKQH